MGHAAHAPFTRADLGGVGGPARGLLAQRQPQTRPIRHEHPAVADLQALVEERLEPVEVDCQARHLSGGSDGEHIRALEFQRSSFFRPLRRGSTAANARRTPQTGSPAVHPARCRIEASRWPEVIRRAGSESLRAIARSFGASPEAVRTVLRRTGNEALVRDEARQRRLAAAVPLPPAPRKVPKERHETSSGSASATPRPRSRRTSGSARRRSGASCEAGRLRSRRTRAPGNPGSLA